MAKLLWVPVRLGRSLQVSVAPSGVISVDHRGVNHKRSDDIMFAREAKK